MSSPFAFVSRDPWQGRAAVILAGDVFAAELTPDQARRLANDLSRAADALAPPRRMNRAALALAVASAVVAISALLGWLARAAS